MTPAVVVAGLNVRYGEHLAVDGLNLEIEPGELFALLGPNGAGKSSTLRVLIGELRPSAGRVSLLGYDVVRALAKIRPRLGYVPDRDNHFEELSGRQNLRFFARLHSLPDARSAECLRALELDDAADLPVKAYSQGMKKKLLVARALLHRPELLVLDEPTANLDVYSAGLVRRMLRDLGAEGTTVLFTSHDMAEVAALAGRVAVLARGRTVALGRPAELAARHESRAVRVTLASGEVRELSLSDPEARAELARLFAGGEAADLETLPRDFAAAFARILERAEN
ncbi:MAG: ABC transporter ATP-binding protein [Polyangiaceae bacterium]